MEPYNPLTMPCITCISFPMCRERARALDSYDPDGIISTDAFVVTKAKRKCVILARHLDLWEAKPAPADNPCETFSQVIKAVYKYLTTGGGMLKYDPSTIPCINCLCYPICRSPITTGAITYYDAYRYIVNSIKERCSILEKYINDFNTKHSNTGDHNLVIFSIYHWLLEGELYHDE